MNSRSRWLLAPLVAFCVASSVASTEQKVNKQDLEELVQHEKDLDEKIEDTQRNICKVALAKSKMPIDAAEVFATDGDSLRLYDKVKIRLQGIDAPEIYQKCRDATNQLYSCGRDAKDFLVELIAGGVICELDDKEEIDRYGRCLAKCYTTDGKDILSAMVEAGHALAEFSENYKDQEKIAKNSKRGIHRGHFIPPKWHRQGIQLKNLDEKLAEITRGIEN